MIRLCMYPFSNSFPRLGCLVGVSSKIDKLWIPLHLFISLCRSLLKKFDLLFYVLTA